MQLCCILFLAERHKVLTGLLTSKLLLMLPCINTAMLVSDGNLNPSAGVTLELKRVIHCFA